MEKFEIKKKHIPPLPVARGENADEIRFASGKIVEMIFRGRLASKISRDTARKMRLPRDLYFAVL